MSFRKCVFETLPKFLRTRSKKRQSYVVYHLESRKSTKITRYASFFSTNKPNERWFMNSVFIERLIISLETDTRHTKQNTFEWELLLFDRTVPNVDAKVYLGLTSYQKRTPFPVGIHQNPPKLCVNTQIIYLQANSPCHTGSSETDVVAQHVSYCVRCPSLPMKL